jgi:hypothetical protein
VLARPVATIAAFLAFAYVGSASGMTTTLAARWRERRAVPHLSPLLGWLGVFITGSDTSANALFGRLQRSPPISDPPSPVLTVAANSSGGVTAKMIRRSRSRLPARRRAGGQGTGSCAHAAALAHHGALRRRDVAAGDVVRVDGAASVGGDDGRRGHPSRRRRQSPCSARSRWWSSCSACSIGRCGARS